jgi:TolB-like protein
MVEERVQRRLTTILAADVVGFSRMMETDEAGTMAALKARRRELLDPLVAKHSGRIFKTTGDGVLVEFASAVNAVQCAVDLQDAMAMANGGQPADRHIVLRIGVNLGDVMVESGDLYGDGVNIAARLEAMAEPGGILISGTAHDHIKNKIKAGFEELGAQSLKNIAEPVRTYRVAGTPTVTAAAPKPISDKPSIVVLPFTNLSGEPNQEYFSDGITEDITLELARFSELLVIARNTAMSFKGKSSDIRKIAAELNVSFVLEGSVRKLAGRVRIAAQLIDGRDGTHIWAERYDGAVEDVFLFQDDVTNRVASAVGAEIRYAQQRRVGREIGSFDAAHDLVWRASKLFDDAILAGDPSLMRKSIEFADRAKQANPDCLSAYRQLVECAGISQLYGWAPDKRANIELAERAARELWTRAPQDYSSFFARSQAKLMVGEFELGIADLRRAFELNPNDSRVIVYLAWAEASAGQTEAAREHARLFLRISPRDRWIGTAYLALAMSSFIDRDFVETRRWAQLAIQHLPTAPIRHALMVACGAEADEYGVVQEHHSYLVGFTPDFIPSLHRGENPIFWRKEHMNLLLNSLRKAEDMLGAPQARHSAENRT